MALAHVCSKCGAILPAETRGTCNACKRPQRSGSSRPELDRYAWQKLRRAVRLRDHNRCVRCGATEGLSVHHAVAGSSALADLVTLCSRCHGREHRKTTSCKANSFFKRQSGHADSSLWRSLAPGYPTLPITELHYDWRPTHWDTPEYRQDVPKR